VIRKIITLEKSNMRVAILANPYAGRGRTRAFGEQLRPELEALGLTATFKWTEKPVEGIELARGLAGDHDILCVIGGDGTVHEAVNGLMPNPIPLVVVPSGSGNDFSKLFPCPRTPQELVETIKTGFGARIDVLDTGVRYCVNSIGIGFEALVTHHSRSIRRLGGVPLYLTAVFKALLSYDTPDLTIELPGGERLTGPRLLVSIGNGICAGGGFYLTPGALPDDGQLELCIVEALNRRRIVRLLPKALNGSHTDKPGVVMRTATAVKISSTAPYHLHIDGEYLGEKRWDLPINILQKSLPVLCRRDGHPRVHGELEKIV
jgi:diacylglycerol kinase (ATP)